MGRAAKRPTPIRGGQRKAKDDPRQGGLFDVVIKDKELEDALTEHVAQKALRSAIAQNAKARKLGLERHSDRLVEGQRIRVGSMCFEVSGRDGGDFEMPAWHARTATKIMPVSEAS